MVFAVRLHQKYSKKSHSLITFGQPRSGNKNLVDYVNANVSTLQRVVYSQDLQSTKPKAKWTYATGLQLEGKDKFIHTSGLKIISQNGFCEYENAKNKDEVYLLKNSSGKCLKTFKSYLTQAVGINLNIH